MNVIDYIEIFDQLETYTSTLIHHDHWHLHVIRVSPYLEKLIKYSLHELLQKTKQSIAKYKYLKEWLHY